MRIAIGSDHAAVLLKTRVIEALKPLDIDVIDLGTEGDQSVDYPDFAKKVAQAVVSKSVDFGIAMCGTGIGISIAANKVKGIRAALVYDTLTARLAKEHNNANVIAMGGRTTTPEDAIMMIEAFMNAKFETRHQKRIDKITALEGDRS
ncbi:MAG: ribose 5-phosphate isomerase B [Acholeplasmataceae bacterium]|nr:ribose 5-phosphate isomerase B [Acholeplasmataceae bacterium]